jgi:hypothetical protein
MPGEQIYDRLATTATTAPIARDPAVTVVPTAPKPTAAANDPYAGMSYTERRKAKAAAYRARQAGSTGTTTGGSTGTTTGGGSSGPLAGTEAWAKNVLGGNFSNLPMYSELTDPKYADPTTNPYIQSMVGGIRGQLQSDWLGNQAQLNEQAEAGGRYGSGAYLSASTKTAQAADTSLANAIAGMYSGAYENERQRRAGLASQFLGAQESAANIPVSIYGIDKNYAASIKSTNAQRQVGMANVSLGRAEFNFTKQMQLQSAGQDALNDYFNLIAGIGGMGGTTYGTSPGTYIPTQSPVGAALLGGLGAGTAVAGIKYGSGG